MALIDARGFTVDVREDGTGPTVILLHSTACDHRQWTALMEQGRARFRFLAVNRFGHGDTPGWERQRPASRARQTMADQAALALAAAEGADAPVHVVGHSLGGTVAMHAALALGARLGRLVLLEPNPFPWLAAHGHTEAYAETMALCAAIRSAATTGAWQAVAETFVDYWNGPGAWAAMTDRTRANVADVLPANLYEWDALLDDTLAPQALAPIAERTLLVRAANTTAAIRGIAEILAAACPTMATATVAAGGHMAPLTRPDLVNPLILEFLEN